MSEGTRTCHYLGVAFSSKRKIKCISFKKTWGTMFFDYLKNMRRVTRANDTKFNIRVSSSLMAASLARILR